MEKVQNAGLAKCIGVSNFSVKKLREVCHSCAGWELCVRLTPHYLYSCRRTRKCPSQARCMAP